MKKREINFGIIGCGLMGREFASAAARWCHLLDQDVVPRIVGVCDTNPAMLGWFTENVDTIRVATQDYHELLSSPLIGAILEVQAGFLHSSDLDPLKPINWKRQVSTNGEYGCMGDLGMHVLHIPLRAGWFPNNVRALLSKIVTERPGRDGTMVPCETWDNAVLACEISRERQHFPMLLEIKRIAPGETNTWYLRMLGTEFSAEFSTKYPKTLRTMAYTPGGLQAWLSQDLGSESAYPTITGGIFEFGFSDSILQMWAAFCDELAHSDSTRQPFYCVTPEETEQSHRILTAALDSNRQAQVVQLNSGSEQWKQ